MLKNLNMQDKKICWFVNSMGFNNELFYWQPLLKNFVEAFPESILLTCETEAKIERTNHEVKKLIPKINFKINKFIFSMPSPLIILKMIKEKPDLLVISEFGLLSIYAVFYRTLYKKNRLLLLVENDPCFLENFFKKKRKNIFFKIIRRMIVKSVDGILCNNQKTAKYLEFDLLASKEKIITACYLTSSQGIKDVKNTPQKEISKKITLLFVGRLIKSKGVHLILEAIRLLSESSKNKLSIKVVGDGPELANLEKVTELYGLSEIVTYYGRRPYDELVKFFSESDIFIFPTLGDYRALVGFEALSAGLPIIGSIFDGASDEIISEGINGFIIDPQNTEMLANKIQFFIENQNKINEFGLASKEIYQYMTPEVAAENIVKAVKFCLTR